MLFKNVFNGKAITRSKFLGLLGKAGLLSILPWTSAHAADGGRQQPVRVKPELRATLNVKSPMIKGKMLSRDALTAKLATDNLEQLRDLLTGRFFGRAAEEAFGQGNTPLINWDLGTEGSDSGCFLFADISGGTKTDPGLIANCFTKVYLRGCTGKLVVDIYATSAVINPAAGLGAECPEKGICPGQCPGYCGDKCTGLYCSGPYCSPKASIDLYEIVSYPADRFAAELTGIIDSSDVGVIQKELQAIIFSDEVLNLGLQQFVTSAFEGMNDNIAGF
jgi:hypothetical protein